MSAPGSLPSLDPALFPALYEQQRVEKDANYWKERFEMLRDRVYSAVRQPQTPLTRIACIEDLLREYFK